MRLLLDSHILLWAILDDPRLPGDARAMIDNLANAIYYSVVSVWEVSIKHSRHPEDMTLSGRELVVYCEEAGFHQIGVHAEHVYALEVLVREKGAPPHRDPFDRMLISQAKTEGMLFLTHDALLPYYNEPCIVFL